MRHGKQVCRILKEIRQQIAEKNDIELFISECHFQGECKGTCPKCEAEVRYLEQELNQRRQLGKAVAVAGISLGMAGAFAGCGTPTQKKVHTVMEDIVLGGIEIIDTLTNTHLHPLIEDSIARKNQSDDIETGSILITEGLIDITPFEKRFNGKTDDIVYQFVEEMPEYLGGEEKLRKFIKENLVYPKDAKENRIQGTVYVGFVVEKDGNLSNMEILRGIGGGCDEEAIRIIKMMPKWKPGKQNGTNVAVKYTIPVKFELPK